MDLFQRPVDGSLHVQPSAVRRRVPVRPAWLGPRAGSDAVAQARDSPLPKELFVMLAAPVPAVEEARIAALRRYGVLDTDPEQGFDDMAWLAGEICGTPMAFVSLVDTEREFFKAAVGSNERESPRDSSFCGHTILADSPLIVPDTREDERFHDNPQVISDVGIRFYAGVPLVTPDGYRIGALCVKDTRPRTLSSDALRALEALGRQVVAQLETRRLLVAEATAVARFEALIKHAPIGIGLMDVTGTFVLTNPAMGSISGFSSEELKRIPLAEYSLPEDYEEIARPFRAMFAGEQASFRQEHRLLDCHGDVVWVDSALSLLPSTSGRPELAIVMAQDITRRRLAEEHVRETQKIEAAGELAAGVAHDFNNLLTGISGYAALARTQVDGGSRLAEYLSQIEGCVERAASLTQQLLAFGRKEALELVDLDLNELIGDAASMLRTLLGPQVTVELALEPELRRVSGDPVQLQRVLLNLTLNARDAMPDGGTLTVHTANADTDPRVVLTVSDTGCGMNPGVQARMFEPFFTTKEHGQGTGLGLSSVHGIVLQTGGDIAVDSAVGEGTTFTITLPTATSRSTPAAAPREVAERKDGGRARVLVVEDQAPVRDLITELLELHNYDVVAAPDAETALSRVDEHEPFDVVLTDIVLPGMDGVALVDALQVQKTKTRVLFMSGYPREHRVDPRLLLAKPFGIDDLLARLDTLHAA